MVSAIGSSTFPSPASNSGSTSGLEAQIARYQQELSNCVNCSTANTLEGKEKIQSLSNKISALRIRIQEISAEKANAQPATPSINTPANINANKDGLASRTQADTVPATGSRTATVGNRLDVFA
jgi:hypothetical protein